MRLNSRIMVYGVKVVLLPYKRHMVLKYHEWMKYPELLQLTASEPLTIEEEYEMQKKWLEDDDKCTFIILDLESYEKTKDEVGSMIGDTNLFFVTEEDAQRTAEAEIMIAETSARRKHKGLEAMVLMLIYGVQELKVKQYQVKIGVSNSVSIQMFKKLGFVEAEVMAAFTTQSTGTMSTTRSSLQHSVLTSPMADPRVTPAGPFKLLVHPGLGSSTEFTTEQQK